MLGNLLKLFLPTTALALEDTSGLGDALWGVADDIWSYAQAIVLALCAVLIIVFGIQLIIAGDAQSVAQAKKRLMYAVIGGIIVFAAPLVVKIFKSLFDGVNTATSLKPGDSGAGNK